MIIVPSGLLSEMQNAVVQLMHGLVDQNGERVVVGTIEPATLRMAALCASAGLSSGSHTKHGSFHTILIPPIMRTCTTSYVHGTFTNFFLRLRTRTMACWRTVKRSPLKSSSLNK